MKRLLGILAIVSVLLFSCVEKQPESVVVEPTPLPFTISDTLLQIDTLLQNRPDSALMLLIEPPSFRAQRGISYTFNESYRNLLLSEALYKTYNLQYYRDDLQAAMRFFDSLAARYPGNDDVSFYAARSHYMNGVSYYETDSVVAACREYLHALEIMEDHFVETHGRTSLQGYKAKFMGLTYTRLGDIFSNNFMAQPAIDSYKEAVRYFLKLKNYSLANTYRVLGTSYLLDNNKDSALYYYRKSIKLAKEQNNSSVYWGVQAEASPLYYDLGNKDSAFIMIREALRMASNEDQYLARCFTYGSMLAKECRYDSAIFYLEQSVNREWFATQTASAECLMKCYKALGDTIKSNYYQKIYSDDFTIYRNNSEITKELAKVYDNYKQEQSYRERLSIKRRQNHINWLIVFGLLALLLLFITLFEIKYRKNVIKSNTIVADKEKTIIEMKRKMEANPFMNEPICITILELANQQFKSRVPCSEYLEYALNKEQLLALKDAMDRYYNNFTQWICKEYPGLTADDIDYCCLYYLGLKDVEVFALMQRAYPTVCERSRKLKRIFKSEEPLYTTIKNIVESHRTSL